MIQKFDIGDTKRVRGEWTNDETGEPVTPTRVKFFLKSPSSEDSWELGVDDEVVQDGSNAAYFDMRLTESGNWARRWVLYDEDDNAVEASETPFVVRRTAFAAPT